MTLRTKLILVAAFTILAITFGVAGICLWNIYLLVLAFFNGLMALAIHKTI